ncbi:PAS domain S-box protein [Azospirillum sp. sgz301742]
MSLLNRLMLLVVLAMIPAVAVQVYNEYELRREREAEVGQQSERLLALIEAEQARLIEGFRQTMVAIRETRSVREGDTPACQAYMTRLKNNYPEFIDFYVTDAEGVVRCGTEIGSTRLRVADRFHFREAVRTAGFVVGEYIQSRATDRPVLPFAMPLQDAAGNTQGIVSALLDLGWLVAYLKAKPLPAGAAITVADRNGIVAVRIPAVPNIVGQMPPDRYMALLSAPTRGVMDLITLDGVPRVVAYSPVDADPKGLFINVGLDKAAAIGSINDATRRSLGLVTASFALLLAGVAVGGNLLLHRPVATLAATARRWREGDLSARTGLKGGTEIVALCHDFDTMANHLEAQMRRREQAEEELRRSSGLLDLVMEHLPVGVMMIAADGRILRLNAASERIWAGRRMVGIDRYGEYKGWWADTGKPVEAHEWAAARAITKGETALGEEIDIECFDGTSKTIRNSAVPLRSGDGAIVGAVVVNEDITERRVARQALEDSEARYRAVVQTAVDAMAIIDERGIIQSFNHAAERIFGYAANEVIGRNVKLLMPEPHHSAHDGYIASYLRTGRGKIIGIGREVEGLHRDGRPIPLELSIAEWRARGQRFFTGIMRDVSRRRAAERHLRENLTLLNTIIESSPDRIFVKDRKGRYLLVNSATAIAHGRPHEQIIGVPEQDLVSLEDGAALAATDRRVMEAGHALTVEETVLSKGHGEPRCYLSTKVPLRDDTGEVIDIIGISRDITERRAMEDELQRAKEAAEQANLAKSKFLAAASHDLRQPMQSLFLFSAALAPHVANERGQKTLTMLERGLDTLKALLDSLLDVSRLDAGVIKPEIGNVALGPIVEDLEAAYTPIAQSKGLTLHAETSCGVAIRSDPMLLGRMVRNLIENAIRYTEHGEVRIGCAIADATARIEVSDTGIGIPPEQLERIFEEFHQVANPERDRTQGLGLGLAIVQRLSRLLDHPVCVRSELGKGSVFAIEVPLGLADAIPTGPPCAPAPVTEAGLLAVVVDDDAMVLAGLRTVLEGWGYEVLIAGSGDEAMERLRESGRTPDVVIADYRLRDDEVGPEVVRRVRAFVGSQVPGILLTGETGPEFQHEAAANDLGLANKPVTPRQLHRALERLLQAGD